ncbi:amino acid ABC transporter permease [Rhodoligotrophos defluvii]|uniref:amino acid ABC transporter permease n=1 Tax=Rhodoligotrophos defluvii TaxID=2561934 RepID=UPI0010CA03A6|nr:ABC transporter permease subunit [Rhodoligotrophos defluvii]
MFSEFDFEVIWNSIGYLFLVGMRFTLLLTLLAGAGGFVLGTLLAIARLSRFHLLSYAAAAYVNLLRSLPLILLIFWFYFLVPFIPQWIFGLPRPVPVGAFLSALIPFILIEAAYFCEIVRAGIQGIPDGQRNAGMALGLNGAQLYRLIILPQAIRNMVPALLTQLLVLFQDTSLVYVLSLTDFLGAATKVGQRDGRLPEMYVFVAVVYLAMSFAFSQYIGKLAKRKK